MLNINDLQNIKIPISLTDKQWAKIAGNCSNTASLYDLFSIFVANNPSGAIFTDYSLKGSGSLLDPLGLKQNGATNGQYLAWDSSESKWLPTSFDFASFISGQSNNSITLGSDNKLYVNVAGSTLSINLLTNKVTITSGNSIDIPAATTSAAGVMSTNQVNKLIESITTISFNGALNVHETPTYGATNKSVTYHSTDNVFGLLGSNSPSNNKIMLLDKETILPKLGIEAYPNLLGVSENSPNLGTFTGGVIPPNLSVKAALEHLANNSSGGSQQVYLTSTVTGGHSGKITCRYSGSTPPTLHKNSSSMWTLTVPSGTILFTADIYSPASDNPGASLTLNIIFNGAIFNLGADSMVIPLIKGLNMGSGTGSFPSNYSPTTGATNLQPKINVAPSLGFLQIVIDNFNNANALGTGATHLKLIF